MSLALDENHDLHLGTNSGIAIARDAEQVVQGILTRLRFFLGESHLDETNGTPYFEQILVDSPDIRVIESTLKRRITSSPGVISPLESFDINFDRGARGLSFTFEANTIFGPSGLVEVSP